MAPDSEIGQSTLTPSWQLFPKSLSLIRQHLEQVIIIALLPALLASLGSLLIQTHGIVGSPIILAGLVWTLGSIAASNYLQLTASQGKFVSTLDCYRKSWRYFGRLILFTILFGFMVVIGFILLIVPGLIIIRRYIFTPFYIIDQDLSISQAMELSAHQTKPIRGYVWGTIGVLAVLTVGSTLVGLIFGFIPGGSTVITALLSVTYFFVAALRYLEISPKPKPTAS
jgi:hypothetical protein